MSAIERPTSLGFLIFPGFPMACLTSAIEPLRAANEISGQDAFTWTLISEHGTQVESSAQVGFNPELALGGVEALDYLFLLSSPLATFESPKSGNGQLRHMARHGTKMGGVSGGVFPLARAGLLGGYSCSVHWCYEASFANEFADHHTTADVITIDRDRYTASGAAAAFDLMLHLIEEKLGGTVTTEVACWFQHPLVRGQGVRQRIPTGAQNSTADMLPPAIQQAIVIFNEHIEDPVNILDVAQMVGLSSRQMERTFKAATGQSPSHYYRGLRMNAARQLVLYSKDTMTQIAQAVGYSTAAPLFHWYTRTFGISPHEDRKKINLFRVEKNITVPS